MHSKLLRSLYAFQSAFGPWDQEAHARTILRSTKGPYIEIGRLTNEDRREIKCIRAFLGILFAGQTNSERYKKRIAQQRKSDGEVEVEVHLISRCAGTEYFTCGSKIGAFTGSSSSRRYTVQSFCTMISSCIATQMYKIFATHVNLQSQCNM